MITDEDAKLLVRNLRMIAKDNDKEAERRISHNATWRRHYEGRADAYRLAAGWLEGIIHEEEASNDLPLS